MKEEHCRVNYSSIIEHRTHQSTLHTIIIQHNNNNIAQYVTV
jgi:hypothetical protein